ncbi:unnamed protein product [Lactuca saligna]|uniref:Transposase-associated domain-containing protein n=1 Tax=Lactuca saligna TaxID=75948 RepID=A0AA35VLJ9_LACSI|nr:unnamed protein product [Lactuca saligna]
MHMDEDRIKYPCIKCRNIPHLEPDSAKYRLYKSGFVPSYWFWDKHGETSIDENTSLGVDDSYTTLNEKHEYSYREMVINAMAPDFTTSNPEEEPIAKDKLFFNMLEDGLPEENNMAGSLYESKKLIQSLGLPVELIGCCRSRCMIYWMGDNKIYQCKFCNADSDYMLHKPQPLPCDDTLRIIDMMMILLGFEHHNTPMNEIKAEARHQPKHALPPSPPTHLSSPPPSLTYAPPVKETHLIPLLLGSLPKGTFFMCLLSQNIVSSFCLQFDVPATSRLQSGLYGDLVRYLYDEPIILIPECDGARILFNLNMEFLQRVLASTESIFKIGSTEPTDLLYDALDHFDRRKEKTDENLRLIKTSLPKAVRVFRCFKT